MTIPDFLAELAALRKGWRWYTTEGGDLRAVRLGDGTVEYCPLTALCVACTGTDLHVDKFYQAAQALGISRIDAGEIASAADEDGLHDEQLAVALRQAVGVQE